MARVCLRKVVNTAVMCRLAPGCLHLSTCQHLKQAQLRAAACMLASVCVVIAVPDARNIRTLSQRTMQVPAGALVVLHGSNVHFSRPNRSACSRHAYTMHVVDGDAAWAPHNWCAQTRLTSDTCDVAWVPVEGHVGVSKPCVPPAALTLLAKRDTCNPLPGVDHI
jgi:hypothetical protein